MSDPYRATGKQLEVPPDARGLSLEKWLTKQTVATRAEIEAHRRKLAEQAAAKAADKEKRR